MAFPSNTSRWSLEPWGYGFGLFIAGLLIGLAIGVAL